MNQKKIIYTAIIGNYDTLKEPDFITEGWEYLCFTDQDIQSKNWKIINVKSEADAIRQARRIKINPPFEYDVCIWMDGSFQIKGDADEFISKAGNYDMMLLKHPHRETIQQEADACRHLNKDNAQTIIRQMNEYKRVASHASLPATGIIYRKNTKQVRIHSLLWVAEVYLHSNRDQLSFGYAARRAGLNFMLINENVYDKSNRFYLLHKHIGK